MSIDYSLELANSGIDENLIKKVLSDMSIKVLKTGELEMGFYFYEFNPDIKMDITFIEKPNYPEEDPENSFETMFRVCDFYCNSRLTYRFHKFVDEGECIIQYKVMLSSVMELARISNKEALFTSNGEDTFFYKNGVFFFEKDAYDFYMDNQRPYKAILEKYSCVEFDGKHL